MTIARFIWHVFLASTVVGIWVGVVTGRALPLSIGGGVAVLAILYRTRNDPFFFGK